MIVELKKWDTDFFNRSIFSVLFDKEELSDKTLFLEKLTELRKIIISEKSGLYELILESKYFHLYAILESFGFKIVDSKFKFITKIDKRELQGYFYELPASYTITKYNKKYYNDLLTLCIEYLIKDSQLISKYKSVYYSNEDLYKYYTTWLINSLNDSESFCSIIVNQDIDAAEGFFIYKKSKLLNDAWYKGILVSLHPKLRGKNLHLGLQEFLFKSFEEESFFIENATQVSNLPVIKNHFLSSRTPKSIEFTFLYNDEINNSFLINESK